MTDDHVGILNAIDRRSFLKKAGLFAVGCMFCGAMTSCADEGIDIPCLGPAAPPVPVPGVTYIRASEIGCALDCDLKTGRNKDTGGTATDDGPKINAAMAAASATNPITLIIDGSALISGLFLPAGGHWSIAGLGCGTGFFIKDGANNDGIHNGPNADIPFDPGPPAPTRGANVSLSNFAINGNQYRVSTLGKKQGGKGVWFCGINLMNLDNINVENVVVVNTPAYHIRLSNVGDVSVSGCVLQSKGLSTDGLHFDGPANDITIANCHFRTDDDSIALNCPEGYSGDISRVTVTGCTFNSWSLMRMYTTNGSPAKFRIDSVIVDNCTGTLAESAFLIGGGVDPRSAKNSVASLTVSNCNLTAPAILAIAENFGTIILQNVAFVPSQASAVWVPPQVNKTPALLRPSPLYGTVAFRGSSLCFKNCRIYRTRNLNVAAVVLGNQSSIDNLEFDGFAVQDAGSYPSIPSLLNVAGGLVGELVLNSLDPANTEAPVEADGFSNVGGVSGTGVLATGWMFPDAVMANGVPYISETTGRPSIKVDGDLEQYPLAY